MEPSELAPHGSIHISPRAIAAIAYQAAVESYGVVGLASKNVFSGLTNLLVKAVGDRALVSPGNPVRLTRHTEPQPDLMLLRPDADYRHEAFVGPGHVLLVVEVAESSLTWDRGVKLRLYARAAIPEVWIVDVEHERVEVHRDPAGGVYRAVEVVPRGGRLGPAALPGVEIAAAAVL